MWGHSVPIQQLFVPPISEFDKTWYVGSTYDFIIPGEVLLSNVVWLLVCG